MNNLTDLGIICSLGEGKEQVLSACLAGDQSGLQVSTNLVPDKPVWVAMAKEECADLSEFPGSYNTRCNQLVWLAYKQIEEQIKALPYPASRIAVVIGTSTSGVASGEQAMQCYLQTGRMPESYHYTMQEMNSPASFIAHLSGAKGPVYTISTACSSSAKALISASNLLTIGLVDAVITGGADSLCKLTLNGFSSLESISKGICRPFSSHRDGINIGEGAALFIMQKGNAGIALAGHAESSDAHHISAPDPKAKGALDVISQAIASAGLRAEDVDYLNLHGTGTVKNDEMEALAVNQLAQNVPCNSTKSLTGHTLGAAGAIEAAICWLLISDYNTTNQLPGDNTISQLDPALASINLIDKTQIAKRQIRTCLSNSFAFGGNNVAVLLSRNNIE